MKNFLYGICLCVLTTAGTCRSDEFDPAKGVFIQMALSTEIVASNATKAGEVFEKTYSFNISDELKSRYNIDPDKLQSFFARSVSIAFNQERCNELASYEVVVTFPNGSTISSPGGCSLASVGGKSSVLFMDGTTTNPQHQAAIQTDYASMIKSGKPLKITFKMKAAKDFDTIGFGVSAALVSEATYLP